MKKIKKGIKIALILYDKVRMGYYEVVGWA